MKPRPANPRIIIVQVEGSGIADIVSESLNPLGPSPAGLTAVTRRLGPFKSDTWNEHVDDTASSAQTFVVALGISADMKVITPQPLGPELAKLIESLPKVVNGDSSFM